MKNIVLIGMMGAGKTTIAKYLSLILHKDYVDMDEYIETKYNMSISDMFKISEDYFREKETHVCKELSKCHDMIIATGGGIINNHKNIEYLKNNGIIIFIDRPIESIYNDIDISHRPLLKDNKDYLYELYKQRYDLYMSCSDYVIKNTGELEIVVKDIIKIVSRS